MTTGGETGRPLQMKDSPSLRQDVDGSALGAQVGELGPLACHHPPRHRLFRSLDVLGSRTHGRGNSTVVLRATHVVRGATYNGTHANPFPLPC